MTNRSVGGSITVWERLRRHAARRIIERASGKTRPTRIGEWVRPYAVRWVVYGAFGWPRPDYFIDCWRYPALDFPPAAGSELDCPAGAVQPDVLFLPMTDWHARLQRTQHLACALASAGHRCFYLNPHLGAQFPNCSRHPLRHALTRLAPGIYEFHVRLPREPVIHQRMPSPREVDVLFAALEALFRHAGVRQLVQVASAPFWSGLCWKVREAFRFPVVYDCHDWLAGFNRIDRDIVEREQELLHQADFILFSSQNLLEKHSVRFPDLRQKAWLVRNAAGGAGRPHSKCTVAGPSNHETKVMGYVGALDDWFDAKAVSLAAQQKPEWQFVLIGRVEDRRILALSDLPNVTLAGEIPHHEVERELARFDVGLIPFVKNELTESVSPIKLYEYFSLGLPVVSADLPEVRPYADLAYLYKESHEFVSKLEMAAMERSPELVQRRMAVSSEETWNRRATQLQCIFGRLLSTGEEAGPTEPPDC